MTATWILGAAAAGALLGTAALAVERTGAAYDFRVRRGNEVFDVHLVLGPPQPPGILAER
ncbi:MAG TPA: hypothetical protein VF092_27395 [Longimicrobium sp.]